MIRRLVLASTAACALVMLVDPPVPALAANVTIGWSSDLVQAVGPDPLSVVGTPDARCTGVSDYAYTWVRRFPTFRTYDAALLAGFLGATTTDITMADVLAFECNGNHPAAGGGWESSTWFFNDLKRSYAETFDENLAHGTILSGRRAVFKTGTVTGAAFNRFFGVTGGNPAMSWMLIRLPADIDTQPLDPVRFSIRVSGALRGEGSPDPDAIGVVHH